MLGKRLAKPLPSSERQKKEKEGVDLAAQGQMVVGGRSVEEEEAVVTPDLDEVDLDILVRQLGEAFREDQVDLHLLLLVEGTDLLRASDLLQVLTVHHVDEYR